MAGYSGTPLPKKLGIKEGARVALLGKPGGFEDTLGGLPAGARMVDAGADGVDVAVLFTTSLADLAGRFREAAERITDAGGLWVAWPKKASGIPTDLNENVIRELGLGEGLVDNKVCAIDETWSGLRFVYRVKDRPARGSRGRAEGSKRGAGS
jgi:hypothetical protein